MAKKTPNPIAEFENSIAELETIVNKMESGELSLEESLSQFERGIHLTQQCQTALQSAEQRVEKLINLKSAETEALDAPNHDDN